MDDEIEDIVGDVRLTESQKSVTMSNVYSLDFTDSSSERHNSSGMETYVLEWDSDESESSALQGNVSIINVKDRPIKPVLINRDAQCEVTNKVNRASSTSYNKGSFIAQEIFTQTSKTIIELAESEGAVRKPIGSATLETQTSLISITENKTVEYRIEVSGKTQRFNKNENINNLIDNHHHDMVCNQIKRNSIDDDSSKFRISETENERTDEYVSDNSSNGKIINILSDDSKYDTTSNTNEFDQSPESTDIEEDSLMGSTYKLQKSNNQNEIINTPKSVDNDVAELYNRLSETIHCHRQSNSEPEKKHCGYLTPLTEESVMRKGTRVDITASPSGTTNDITDPNEEDKDVLFTNNAGIKVKMFPKAENTNNSDSFKLPPILCNNSCSEGGNLNFLFSINQNKLTSSNLACVHEERREKNVDRWEIGNKNLASGESPLISGRSDRASHAAVQLPPIHVEGVVTNNSSKAEHHVVKISKTEVLAESQSPISIKEKIKELKLSHRPRNSWGHTKYFPGSDTRSGSPSTVSPDEGKTADAAERGCELLCVDLLKRLRSHSWFEVADVLDDLPRVLDKFWGIIPEQRIADLIRQVSIHVESPRTQVARAACNTLAMILKNTNYTKKPDFYEAVTILLIKTGSFSRPVRHAANVALDGIVCGVDLSHAVTALCIHGAGHKSPLVRCAAARLLVVCCALGSGGRELLRARPPTAASARRHALRSLAALLDDKNTDARKYAERLYSMLRPLSNFEAYYLTDVDVELASRQMKKYDQMLLCGPPETR